MISYNIGSTIVNVCESTARCVIYQPTETYFDQLIDFVQKNNYICIGIHSTKDIGKKVEYYLAGTLSVDEKDILKLEETFE